MQVEFVLLQKDPQRMINYEKHYHLLAKMACPAINLWLYNQKFMTKKPIQYLLFILSVFVGGIKKKVLQAFILFPTITTSISRGIWPFAIYQFAIFQFATVGSSHEPVGHMPVRHSRFAIWASSPYTHWTMNSFVILWYGKVRLYILYYICLYGELAYGELVHMANWLIWRTDCGHLAYGKLENGEMTSFPLQEISNNLGQKFLEWDFLWEYTQL